MSRLRGQSLTVQSLDEKSHRGEPDDPDKVLRRSSPVASPSGEGAGAPKPRRLFAIVIAVLLLAAAVALFKLVILLSLILGALGVFFLLIAIFATRIYEAVSVTERRRKSHRM